MDVQYLTRPGKPRLAYIHTPAGPQGARYPLVMFLGGYRSDMQGMKASYLEQQCLERGQAYVRFDYSGHGLSEGKFENGTIGDWMGDALDIFDFFNASHPAILAGSSMGGWIALLLALKRAGSVKGLVGIAAAPDFTEQMYHERLTADQRAAMDERGYFEVPNDFAAGSYMFTRKFYEEAKNHLLLDKTRSVDFPLRLVQGMQDREVPWETAIQIQRTFQGSEADIIFIEDGDHRLSRPEDLEIIGKEVRSLSGIL